MILDILLVVLRQGLDRPDVLLGHAEALDDAEQVLARAVARLAAGHGRRRVVEDDDGHVGVGRWPRRASGVMPEWAKVESPMTETAGWRPTSDAPRAMLTLAPMQTQLWMAL